jgi:hypothetical protein
MAALGEVINQQRVILGDLTTVFRPPDECTIAIGYCKTCFYAWWGQKCTDETVRDATDCWPTTTEGVPKPTLGPLSGWGFYSPGVMCPQGYTSACGATAGSTSDFVHQFQMKPSETFVGCCPSGFECSNLNGQTCVWTATETAIPTVSCGVDGASDNFGFTTVPNSAISELLVFAPMIQIARQPSDRPFSIATTTSSSSISVSTSSTNTNNPDADANASSTPNPTLATDSPTLSIGAIAGIAVGGGIVFLLILAAAIFIWRRKRSQHHPPGGGGGSSRGPGSDTISNPPAYTSVPGGSPTSDVKQFQHYYAAGGVVEIGQGEERVEAPGEGMGPAEVSAQGHDRVELFAGAGGGYPAPHHQQQQYQQQGQYGQAPHHAPPPPGFQGQGGMYYVGEGGAYQPGGHGAVEMPAQRY